MQHKKFWILVLCLGFIFPLMSHAQSRDVDKRDLQGISPKYHKYIFSWLAARPWAQALALFCREKKHL
jgi:hypothetical protein